MHKALKRFPKRRSFYNIAMVSTLTGLGLSFLPEVLYPDLYKLVYGFYFGPNKYDRKLLPVTPELNQLLLLELNKLNLSSDSKLDLFFSNTTYPVLIGSLRNAKGASLGLPHYLGFLDNEASVNQLSSSLLGFSEVNGNLHTASAWAQSMIMTAGAKKFLVARSLRELSHNTMLYKFGCLGISTLIGLIFSLLTCAFIQARKRPKYGPLLLTFFTIANYLVLWSNFRSWIEKASDQDVVEMGQDYVLGGFEFYERQLYHHKVRRQLLKDDRFTPNGNETDFLLLGMRTCERFDHFKRCVEKRNERLREAAANGTWHWAVQ